jgi:type VI secretion system protein
MKNYLHHGLPLLLCAALSGCGTVGNVASSAANLFTADPASTYIEWKGLLVSADADANQNSPVALDIVFVHDTATLDKLSTLPASRWFATRDEQLRLYPQSLRVRSYEMVPRQMLRLPNDELGTHHVVGVLLFANYTTPGEHRARLPELRGGGLVRLGARSFTVSDHPL